MIDRPLDMGDLSLSWAWGFNPLRRLPSNTTDKVCVSQRLWGPLLHLDIQRRGNWLRNPAMQRRRPAGNRQRVIVSVPGDGTIRGLRAVKGRLVAK